MELNFEGLEMQRWNVPTGIIQIDEKSGVICLVNTVFTQKDLSHLNILPKFWLIVCCRQQKEQKEPCFTF